MKGDLIPVVVKDLGGSSVAAQVPVRAYTGGERLLRSAKILALFWGISLLTVLIPVAHFVLVPLFFLLGPIVAMMVYKKTVSLTGGDVTCPNCHQVFSLNAGPILWPLRRNCEHCRYQLVIEPV